MNNSVKAINRAAVRIDGGTQARVQLNLQAVEDYRNAIAEGRALPPITVFFDGSDFWLADGFHRWHAQDDKAAVQADVRSGTRRDAILYACGANANHGLQRSNEDKRRAVAIMLADAEWSAMSDRDIAKHCAVSHTFVSNLRKPKAEKPKAAPATAAEPAAEPAPSAAGASPAGNVATDDDDGELGSDSSADQIAEAAHGDDDLDGLVTELQSEVALLQEQVKAAGADDLKSKVMELTRVADIERRRKNELMQVVKDREDELKRATRTIRRICQAVGEEDPTKVAATVEAFVRHAKVAG